jgi:hypothetical protein
MSKATGYGLDSLNRALADGVKSVADGLTFSFGRIPFPSVVIQHPPIAEEKKASLDAQFPPYKTLTRSEAESFLSMVKIGPFPFAKQTYIVRLDVATTLNHFTVARDHVLVQLLVADIPDREDRSRTIGLTFTAREYIQDRLLSRSVLEMHIREFLFRIVRHEMAEWILIDGVRVFDPHADGSNNI